MIDRLLDWGERAKKRTERRKAEKEREELSMSSMWVSAVREDVGSYATVRKRVSENLGEGDENTNREGIKKDKPVQPPAQAFTKNKKNRSANITISKPR